MISRHFIDIGKNSNRRSVHYRKAGNGPPLLMIHQSPRSSKEYEALMLKWSTHFTCIAPDTPGFGHSDPLPGDPEIDRFADGITEFLDAIGIEKCAAYGFHSGGIFLVTAVKRHANRFTTLAIGGYAIWTADEIALFGDQYLPEFHPSRFGEHLTWLWNRVLEQTWFFPWFAADNDHRQRFAHDDPARVNLVIQDMLNSGNAYRAGYGAILRAPRDIPDPKAIVPPCLITAYDGDPLQDHIGRLGEMPDGWSARKVETPEKQETASLAHLLETETPPLETLCESDREGFCTVKTDEFRGQIHWRGRKDARNLFLHAPGKACPNDPPADQIAIDLPGHGLSDMWPGKPPTSWPEWQAVIDAAAAALGTDNIVQEQLPKGDPAALYPDLSPDRFGHYLQKAWQIVRARQIFSPWYECNPDHAIDFEPDDVKPEYLAVEHLALLNARASTEYHIALQDQL